MLKVVVIGSGNVAQHLISVFNQSGNIKVVQAFARNPAALYHLLTAEKITDSYPQIEEADVYFIAVSDNAVAGISSNLPFSGRLVVHTSGSIAITQLDAKNRRGVFYPLQTFSKQKDVDFSQVPICLESESEKDYAILKTLADSASGNVYSINSQQRQSLHIAAVFVSNFVNHMYTLGNSICEENQISFDILKPLIQETANKVQELQPKEAQTGPAKRHDTATIDSHLNFLTDDNLKSIYKLLTKSIQSHT